MTNRSEKIILYFKFYLPFYLTNFEELMEAFKNYKKRGKLMRRDLLIFILGIALLIAGSITMTWEAGIIGMFLIPIGVILCIIVIAIQKPVKQIDKTKKEEKE